MTWYTGVPINVARLGFFPSNLMMQQKRKKDHKYRARERERESINCVRYLTGSECNIRMHSRKERRGKNCQWEKKSREAMGKEGDM